MPSQPRSCYISDTSILDLVNEISRLITNKSAGSHTIGTKIIMMPPEVVAYNIGIILEKAIEKAENLTQLCDGLA